MNVAQLKAKVEAQFTALVNGINTVLTDVTQFVFASGNIAKADLVNLFSSRIAAAEKTKAARLALHAAVADEEKLAAKVAPYRIDMRNYLIMRYGKGSPTLQVFLRAAAQGKVDVSTKPARKLTAKDYRKLVAEELDELTDALVKDLKERVFPLPLAKGATSLDFEVFPEPLDGKLPIVGYQMNGDSQVTTSNVEILPDRSPVVPDRVFESFRDAGIDDTDAIHAELVMKWFVRGWRKAGGGKQAGWPSSVMIHDGDDRIVLRS